jgi:hypothetical protein
MQNLGAGLKYFKKCFELHHCPKIEKETQTDRQIE